MDHVFMVNADPARNTDKYWEALVTGSRVWLHWGRSGTQGQSKVKTFESDYLARHYFGGRMAEKMSEGYQPCARPNNAPDLDTVLDVESPEPAPAKPYYLAWQASEPISAENLHTSAVLAHLILMEAGNPADMEVRWVDGELGGRVEVRAAEETAWFGYPPREFLEALSSRERIAVLEKGASRDGWLSAKGTGQGVMVTGREALDFPVRLFLSILTGKSQGALSGTDSDDLALTGRVTMPLEAELFAWYPLWESTLKHAVENHWVIEGQVAMITGTDTQYAW